MVQPRPIVQRVHAAPAVEENHDRRRRRLRRVRLEDPVLLIARAVAVLRHPGMHILFAAWTGIRLRWWSRSLCESSEGECEQNCKTDDFTSHISLGLNGFHARVATTSRYSASRSEERRVGKECRFWR